MANAPKILGTDTLRQAYPKINQAIDNANEALSKATTAETNSINAVNTANQAEQTANSVQAQLNQIVIEGDSSVEAAQARVDAEGNVYTTLKERIDAEQIKIGILTKNKRFVSKTIEKMLYGQPVTIVCYGDSITYGHRYTDGSQVTNPYPKVLQDKLRSLYNNSNITVINSGMSGRQTDEALANLQTKVLDYDPDMLIFMMGINDVRGHPTYGAIVPPDDYRANLESLVKQVRKAGIEVILMTPNPILDTNNNFHRKLLTYARIVKEVAQSYECAFLDLQFEIQKLFFRRAEAPATLLPDNIHFADDKYRLIAEILIGRILYNSSASNVLNIDRQEEISVPVVDSAYIDTDLTTEITFSEEAQFFRKNYQMNSTGTGGTYLRFHFFVETPNMDLILKTPKNKDGGKIWVTHNGVNIKEINGYAKELHVFESEEILIENIPVGFHTIEFLSTNMSVGQSALGTWSKFYFTEFVFRPSKKTKNKIWILNATDTPAVVENYKKIIDGRIKFTNTTVGGTGYLLFDGPRAELKPGKTLVIEAEGKFYDGMGITWFGNKANDNANGANNPSYVNAGYLYYLRSTSGHSLYCFQENNKYGTELATTPGTIDFNVEHKIRIEHTDAGLITIFLDGTQVIQHTNNYAYNGWFGIYGFYAGTAEIKRYEFCYI